MSLSDVVRLLLTEDPQDDRVRGPMGWPIRLCGNRELDRLKGDVLHSYSIGSSEFLQSVARETVAGLGATPARGDQKGSCSQFVNRAVDPERPLPRPRYFLRVYGDWFVGLSVTPCWLACD
jgi:hypothetical protein